jgi:hypothetical protein
VVSAPPVLENAFTTAVLRAMSLSPRELSLEAILAYGKQTDRRTSQLLDKLVGDSLKLSSGGPADADAITALMADVHAARRFYERDDRNTNPYLAAPVANAPVKPVPLPTPDFHERAGMLGDLSPLLRRLGLVIDVRVEDPAMLSKARWIQAELQVEGFDVSAATQPRTACRVAGHAFAVPSEQGDWELGMLKVGDEQRFTLLDLDPDATALKLEQFIRTIPRLVASAKNGDPTTGAPSTLRATGFALARAGRALQLQSRLQGAPAKMVAFRSGSLPPLTQEQVARGLRLEVWDSVSGKWHTLHRRLLTVTVDGAGTVLDRVEDTGFLQGAALVSADASASDRRFAHEVMAGWDGWSLSAPRPGKVLVHDAGEETLHDRAPESDVRPNPVEVTSEVAPGTLPRLRYGRRYAFRAFAVDLAGNSRPHDVVGVPSLLTPRGPGGATPSRTDVTLTASEAGQMLQTSRAALPRDAMRITTWRDNDGASALLRADVLARRPDGGSMAQEPVPPLDFRAPSITRVEAVDQFVAARLAQRMEQQALRAVPRLVQIERTFAELLAQSPQVFERTHLAADASREEVTREGGALQAQLLDQPELSFALGPAGGLDVGQIVATLATTMTTPRPFLRWDPVIEPAVVARHAFSEGESLLRMVIRSGVSQDAPGALTVNVTEPAAFANDAMAAHPTLGLVWRAASERHLAPPKTSQFDAELHGAFEEAIGPARGAAAVRAQLAIALREAGSFLDVTIADLQTPGARVPQPGVTFHAAPTADVAVSDPSTLAKGDGLSPGQYVAHDVDELALPYLPDPLAEGISLTFPDAGREDMLTGPLALEGTTLPYRGSWPTRVPFRLVLESGPALGATVDGHVIRVTLPPGEQLRVRLSSSLTARALDLLGLWRSLSPTLKNHAVVREAARDGWFWWLTPATELRLVHAVPRPVAVPRAMRLLPHRTAGELAVALVGAVDVHGPSTDRLDLEGRWTEFVDDVSKEGPEAVQTEGIACSTPVRSHEDVVVLGRTASTMPIRDGVTVLVHEAMHQLPDTRRRVVAYRPRATTRYREYFPALLTPSRDDLSVVGPEITVDVPSSARPPRVVVRDVLPLFRWSEQTEPAQPFALRRTRRAGVRLYLDRPWYQTGEGELLGVIFGDGTQDALTEAVTQWGGDPLYPGNHPAVRDTLPVTDLLRFFGLDDREEAGRFVGQPAQHRLMDRAGQPLVWVLGYRPEYSATRKQWFVDIAFDPGRMVWPFVRLAVARYQPNSLPGMHLGPVAVCDYVQLPPERSATLSRTDAMHARVVVTGPATPLYTQPRRTPSPDEITRTRVMRARVERYVSEVGTDLAWQTIEQRDLPILGMDAGMVSWAGELPLPEAVEVSTPGNNESWRVTIEEWEYLPADVNAGGSGGMQPRIIYADHLAL